MISLKAIMSICLGATLCVAAQTINISGTVQDNAGAGISGATVKLENAGLSITTGDDGSFTFTGTAGIKIKTGTGSVSKPIVFQNNRIKITLSEKALVSVKAYDISGRQILSSRKMHNAGTHIIKPSLQSNGMYLYKVTIGNNAYSFKATSFGFSLIGKNAISGNAVITSEASASTKISNIIAVVADGQIDYYDSMRTSDTSGVLIKMIPNAGNVTDIDGNVYQSAKIGNQVWTVQNLRVTKYDDGSAITLDTSTATWWYDTLGNYDTTGKYCFYGNSIDTAYQKKWGSLYNWYAVSTGKLAPSGWHVPTDAEWDTLENYLIANGYNYDGTTTDDKTAKSLTAKRDWYVYSDTGTPGDRPSQNNSSGFSALPGGDRSSSGTFGNQSVYGSWWSATELATSSAYFRNLYYGSEDLFRRDHYRGCGLSVRLLQD